MELGIISLVHKTKSIYDVICHFILSILANVSRQPESSVNVIITQQCAHIIEKANINIGRNDFTMIMVHSRKMNWISICVKKKSSIWKHVATWIQDTSLWVQNNLVVENITLFVFEKKGFENIHNLII